MKGIGPTTANKVARAVLAGDDKALGRFVKRFPGLAEVLALLDNLRTGAPSPAQAMEAVHAYYMPLMADVYPDDYPRRQQGLEQLARIAAGYDDLDDFLADMSLENPEDPGNQVHEDRVVLSTIHSAKGLEYSAVLLIDLVEDRFPSKRSMQRPEDLEEERRLMYVACTRARRHLDLLVPDTVYVRHRNRSEPVSPSPFVADIPREVVEPWRETFSGGLARVEDASRPGNASGASGALAPDSPNPPTSPNSPNSPDRSDSNPTAAASAASAGNAQRLGHCRHKVFGRGKIVADLGGGKYRVNFPGFGLKVIIAQYLEME
jgi:DNA helicase-2/ATP-dependent DNA helicase PcrA